MHKKIENINISIAKTTENEKMQCFPPFVKQVAPTRPWKASPLRGAHLLAVTCKLTDHHLIPLNGETGRPIVIETLLTTFFT